MNTSEWESIQARGIDQISSSNGDKIFPSVTEQARIAASDLDWQINQHTGQIRDTRGKVVAESLEELSELFESAGVFIYNDNGNIIGTNWGNLDVFR